MKTDDLIAALSRETPAVPPRAPEKRLGLAVLAALFGSAVIVLAFLGPRADLASVPTASLLKALLGVALESHLAPGRQDWRPGAPLAFGVSITDACIGWEETTTLLDEIADASAAGSSRA